MAAPYTRMLDTRRQAGLTLIELLVAVAIFAILSGIAYRALTVVLESRGRIEQENRKWRELAIFLARLEQDIATAVPRPIRSAGDTIAPAFVGNAGGLRVNEGTVMLTRTALSVEPEHVEPPRRLGYRLRGNVVELMTWNALDQGPREEPRIVVALRDVKEMQVSYVERSGQRLAAWPPPGAPDMIATLPSGVEVSLTLLSGERITRLFPTTARTLQQ
jgi:general secretion pathway protein J